MHYIIYKTTNLINGKFYVGKHQTNDLNDGYVGSGKLLKRAIKKYGLDQFKTEILEVCLTEVHMNLAEKIYVVVDDEVSYNLCSGGKGGFGYINDNGLRGTNTPEGRKKSSKSIKQWISANPEARRLRDQKSSITLKQKYASGELFHENRMAGKKHTVESIQRMKESAAGKHVGDRNSQFGTMWITNGDSNAKIKIKDSVPDGWYRGRTFYRCTSKMVMRGSA